VTLDRPDIERHVQIEGGVEYRRVYSAPLAAKDTKVNDATKSDFMRSTEGKKYTVGEMWEISQEMSEHRKAKQGEDKVEQKFHEEYKKQNHADHPDVIKRREMGANEQLFKEYGIKVS
jgi:hypothetical protein